MRVLAARTAAIATRQISVRRAGFLPAEGRVWMERLAPVLLFAALFDIACFDVSGKKPDGKAYCAY